MRKIFQKKKMLDKSKKTQPSNPTSKIQKKKKKPKLNDAKIPPTGKFEISNIPFNFRHG
jgi:hypothetical protein